MSHTRVKTTYEIEGPYASTEIKTLYCHHNHSCDCVTYYDEDGIVMDMNFCDWSKGNDLWDAMNKLWYPFEDAWNGQLKEGVGYYTKIEKDVTKLKVGDKVTYSFGGKQEEPTTIKTISHFDHGIRDYSEEYCCINGMYWRYEDIIIINQGL
jgi:hypothetical protein